MLSSRMNGRMLLTSHAIYNRSSCSPGPVSSHVRCVRRVGSMVVVAARKKDSSSSSNAEEGDLFQSRMAALEMREAELWNRQVNMSNQLAKDSQAMYKNLQDAYESLKDYHSVEKDAWLAREDSLIRENEALRNKLLYIMTRMNDMSSKLGSTAMSDESWIDGTPASGEIAVTSSVDEDARVSSQSRKNTIESDFAAAFAAVEHGDILKDDPLSFVSPNDEMRSEVPEQEDMSDADTPVIPSGPPPNLTFGDDDIYWMNQLHVALVDAGFYPGDEDIDDFIFGESTQSALLTFQACNCLPETGVADMNTWKELLGEDLGRKQSRDLTEDMNPLTEKKNPASADTAKQKPFAELFSAETIKVKVSDVATGSETVQEETHIHDEKYFSDGHMEVVDKHVSSESNRTKWPVLLEGEGGKEVHALHVLLENAGYWPSEDDLQWWQFGDSTVTAIKTFQACNGMAESGTCDERVWKALLGKDAHPSMIDGIKSGKSDDEDLATDGTDNRVWLIGEQRWEDRSKL